MWDPDTADDPVLGTLIRAAAVLQGEDGRY
jgi:hypothetical protein